MARIFIMNLETENIIEKVILEFYKKATTDVQLGYHFRKIQEFQLDEFKHHPLRPPIEAFADHLPIINEFWNRQLGAEAKQSDIQFDLINKHFYLSLRLGELRRFHLLFNETIEEFSAELSEKSYYQPWLQKLDHFVNIFSRSKIFKN
jgi:hypothetical protein